MVSGCSIRWQPGCNFNRTVNLLYFHLTISRQKTNVTWPYHEGCSSYEGCSFQLSPSPWRPQNHSQNRVKFIEKGVSLEKYR